MTTPIADRECAEQCAKAANLQLTPEQLASLTKRFEFARTWYRIWSGAVASHVTTAKLRHRLAKAKRAAALLEPLTKGPLGLLITQQGVDPRTIPPLIAAIRAVELPGPALKRGGVRHHGDVALRELVAKLVKSYQAVTGRYALGGIDPVTGRGGPLVRFVEAYFTAIGVRRKSHTAIVGLIGRSRRE